MGRILHLGHLANRCCFVRRRSRPRGVARRDRRVDLPHRTRSDGHRAPPSPAVESGQGAHHHRSSGSRPRHRRVRFGARAKEEFADFGEPTNLRARAELLDEGLGIIDAIFAGDRLDHDGPAYSVHARLRPRGFQRPRPPIWVASIGTNRGPVARARRWDGVFTLTEDFQGLTPADVHAWRDRVGRDESYAITTTARAGVRSRDLEAAGLNWRVSEPPHLHNNWITNLRPLVLAGPDASDF